MLKGHAIIELTNVKTGEVEKYEESNLITNAASEYINSQLPMQADGASIINSWYLPLQSKSLGGIALFADTINEDASITYFPENNQLLGFGGTKVDQGLDPKWGSKNLAESEAYDPITKRIKYVWDFKTNQAIGTISCVGLIPGSQGNFYGESLWNENYGYCSNISEFFTRDEVLHMVEFEGNIFTSILNGTGKVTINTYEVDFNALGLNEKIGHRNLLNSTEITMPLSSTNYDGCIWKSTDTHWYGFKIFYNSDYSSYNVPTIDPIGSYYKGANKFLQIIVINKTTKDMEYHELSLSQYINPRLGCLITKNYIFFPYTSSSDITSTNSFSRTSMLKISLSDWSVTSHTLVNQDGVQQMLKQNSSYPFDVIYGGGFILIELPNKTYMFNNLILNDDGIVINNTPGPINTTNYIPEYTDTSTYNAYNWYVSTIPGIRLNNTNFGGQGAGGSYSYGQNSSSIVGTVKLIINKAQSCIIWVGYPSITIYTKKSDGTTSGSGTYYWSRPNPTIYAMPLYSQKLMTINNLETPIEKTSDKTMKITYVLTEVDEEASET